MSIAANNSIAYFGEGAAVTAATTTEIWAADGGARHITGNTTITSLGTSTSIGRTMLLIFDGTPILTQGANLNLNAGGANVTIAAGDMAIVYADTTTQHDVFVIRKSGQAVVGSTGSLQALVIACSDETSSITASTGKVKFRMPYALNLYAGTAGARASLTTAQASGNIFTVDINEGGTTILSTKLTIVNTETTSVTAAIPVVISDTSLADNAEITVDVDQIGNGSATGLKVCLIGTVP